MATLGVSEGVTGCWWRGIILSAFRLFRFQTCMSKFSARHLKLQAPQKLRSRSQRYPLDPPLNGPGKTKMFEIHCSVYLGFRVSP